MTLLTPTHDPAPFGPQTDPSSGQVGRLIRAGQADSSRLKRMPLHSYFCIAKVCGFKVLM
ncbi:MAG: hypothetical protein JWR22_4118 [Herminiimonas sp.]|nr:hypothetical protein [Herminiimonas sp.]